MEKNKTITVSPLKLALSFLKIGLTAYGIAILQQMRATILGNRWLSPEKFEEGLAMVQLYPGPIMFDLGTYSAYEICGFTCAALAMFSFLLPSYLLMVALSYVYFKFGNVSWIHPLFLALEAMVVGVITHIFIDFVKKYALSWQGILIATLSFVLMIFQVSAILIIFLAALLSMIIITKIKNPRKNVKAFETSSHTGSIEKVGFGATALVFVGLIVLTIISPKGSAAALTTSMFKIGAVAFGNAFTIMPLMQQEVVSIHHWLTLKQFSDGIALGQITPGPFLITAVFIGYKVSGIPGSALAAFAIFFPSFFYTLIATLTYAKIRNNMYVKKAIKGILSAFTGMLLYVLISIGKFSLKNPVAIIWALWAFVAVRFLKLNLLWVFFIGLTFTVFFYI